MTQKILFLFIYVLYYDKYPLDKCYRDVVFFRFQENTIFFILFKITFM